VLVLYRVISLHSKNSTTSAKGYEVVGEADGSVEIEKLPLRQVR
jgi:hypothetical protein